MSDSSPKAYPRGLPFEPTPPGTGREVHLWGWALVLIAAVVLGLLVVAGAGLLLLGQVLAARRAEQIALTEARDATPLPPKTERLPERPAQPEVSPAQPSAKDTKPAPAAGVPGERVREALDELCTAHLYQSHFNVCLLADAVEKEVYTQAQAEKFLDAVLELMDKVDRQLTRLADLSLQPEEQKKLQRVGRVAALLRSEAKALRAYWKSSAEEEAKQFHKAREAAWAGIQDLLGSAKGSRRD
jgi:hypothetical protein